MNEEQQQQNGHETAAETLPAAQQTSRVPVRFGFAPSTIDEAWRMAGMIAKSALAPKDYQGKPENVIVAMQMGAEIGLAPMASIQNIAVINGRPSIWGDVALAIVQASGSLEWLDEKVTPTGATCRAKRKGWPDPIERTFTLDDAKTAGLAGKQGPWTQYPKRMMQMRARSWVLRDGFADALRGLSVAEEVMDIDLEPTVGEGGTVTHERPRPQRKSETEKAEDPKPEQEPTESAASDPAPGAPPVDPEPAAPEETTSTTRELPSGSRIVNRDEPAKAPNGNAGKLDPSKLTPLYRAQAAYEKAIGQGTAAKLLREMHDTDKLSSLTDAQADEYLAALQDGAR